MYSMNFFLEKYAISKKIIYKWQQVTMYYYLCYHTLLPWRFFGVDEGENFIGFLSFIVINCVIFIVIADKSKCYKNETYSPYYPYVVLYYFLPCKSRSTTCNLKISSHSVTSFANSKGKWCITMQFCLKLEWCIEFWGATQYRYVQFQEFSPHFLVFIYQKISPTDFSPYVNKQSYYTNFV